jgi:hypothetical protein
VARRCGQLHVELAPRERHAGRNEKIKQHDEQRDDRRVLRHGSPPAGTTRAAEATSRAADYLNNVRGNNVRGNNSRGNNIRGNNVRGTVARGSTGRGGDAAPIVPFEAAVTALFCARSGSAAMARSCLRPAFSARFLPGDTTPNRPNAREPSLRRSAP